MLSLPVDEKLMMKLAIVKTPRGIEVRFFTTLFEALEELHEREQHEKHSECETSFRAHTRVVTHFDAAEGRLACHAVIADTQHQ